ncbi:MAG: hypothetical protein AMJ45_04515 [Syntrophobacter sp. DG_60]|nr:MAG: hypothetical protein AMJ45_04515 [Syntrophobacter sp. DG_60]
MFSLLKFSKQEKRKTVTLKEKFTCFEKLLAENNQILEIIADMEGKITASKPFNMRYIKRNCQMLSEKVRCVIDYLDRMSGEKHRELYQAYEQINATLKEKLVKKKEIPFWEWTIPLKDITKEKVNMVGGKMANLGEMLNLGLPVPYGFAITTYAYRRFLDYNKLQVKIDERLSDLDIAKLESLERISQDLKCMILEAEMPEELEAAILHSYSQLEEKTCKHVPISIRSSAIGEDSDSTFAGQYFTALNVRREQIIQKYKEVIASKFTPRAIFYWENIGVSDEDIAMSVGCVAMVEAKASGVMYSVDPNNIRNDQIVISAVWGLGSYAVLGKVSPDIYRVSKDDGVILDKKIGHKRVMLACQYSGVKEVKVPEALQNEPCLSEHEIKALYDYAQTLEAHFQRPQDIEWVLDQNGSLYLLQTRPLTITSSCAEVRVDANKIPNKVLINEGIVASCGVGSGPAYVVKDDKDISNFPEGAVLITKHTSPKFVKVMKKAVAIITDVGNATGHMASLAREFEVPCIVDTKVATKLITPDMVVTVDANANRVYEGKVDQLIRSDYQKANPMAGSITFRKMEEVLQDIAPLRLVDANDPSFQAKSCRTFHDITRFAHEMSLDVMFSIGTTSLGKIGEAKKLITNIPLNVYIIDIGGGLTKETADLKKIGVEHIASIPAKALWRGMSHKDMPWAGREIIDFKGFLSIMVHGMTEVSEYGQMVGKKIGDRNYLIVSKNYMNFHLRVAYHFCTVDAYCSDDEENNYITFRFMGGAADSLRRARRARFIDEVLRNLDFSVTRKADLVMARIVKYDRETIEEKLDMLGRLMGYARQLDMVMPSEAAVDAYIEAFMKGKYGFNLAQ